jgi:cytochrome b pre-mRNA-processing protein 3
MAEGFHGRALAYREALAGEPLSLVDVLRRNAYGGTSPQDEQVKCLEASVRHYVDRLAKMPRRELIK